MNKDDAYNALLQYIADLPTYLNENLTESDTRAKFVDVFLKDVLGWREELIRRERTFWDNGEKAVLDYEVGYGKPLFVVEAKRQRHEFEIPDTRSPFLYKLDGVIQSHRSIWEVICQGKKYCDRTGIPYAIVTNGQQFAVFRAITIGFPWQSGSAAVFDVHGLRDRYFSQVFNALAVTTCVPPAIDALLGLAADPIQPLRVAESAGPHAGRLRNRMTDVVEQTVSEILRDQPEPTEEFLRECYEVDQTTEHYAKSLQSLLHDPVPVFTPRAHKVKPGHRKDPFAMAMAANIERKGIRPPILLIGGKGFGKTTFLQWFFKVSPFRDAMEDIVALWIDFRGEGYKASDVPRELRKALVHKLEHHPVLGADNFNVLLEVFRDKIAAEKKRLLAPFADDETLLARKIAERIDHWQADHQAYLGELLRYTTEHCKKQVLIVLDNADQKDAAFQYEVHDLAQQLATSFPVTIVLSLRESTFFRLSKSPRADAFSQQQVFHIRAPRLELVISARFVYLADLLKARDVSIQSATGVTLTVKNINRFVEFLKRSLLDSRQAAQILELLASMSNGSVRGALNLIYEFLVSGHTKMDDYFWKYAVRSKSYVPFHEFLASVLLDEMPFFSEENSHSFLNIFARSGVATDSHFFRLRLLSAIEKLSSGNAFRPEDYVPMAEVKREFASTGCSEAVVDAHIQTLVRFGLVQADTQAGLAEPTTLKQEYEDIGGLHITAAGRYYLSTLSRSFTYVHLIIPDTPIFDKDAFARIDAIYRPFKSRDFIVPTDHAIEGAMEFLSYLKTEEEKEHASGALSRSDLLSGIWFGKAMDESLSREVRQIEDALARIKAGAELHPK